MNATERTESPKDSQARPDWVEAVLGQVGSLRFGLVQIVVHDGQVVQIEKTEKIRLNHRPDEHR